MQKADFTEKAKQSIGKNEHEFLSLLGQTNFNLIQDPSKNNKEIVDKLEKIKKITSKSANNSMIAYAFNYNTFLIFNLLKQKFNSHADFAYYSYLEKNLLSLIEKDCMKPLTSFARESGPYRHIFKTFSEENVEEFIKVSNKIPSMSCFNIQEKASLMDIEDWQELWKVFANMTMYVQAYEMIPPKLLPVLENIAIQLNQDPEFKNQDTSNPDSQNEIIKKATKKMLESPDLEQLISSIATSIGSQMMGFSNEPLQTSAKGIKVSKKLDNYR